MTEKQRRFRQYCLMIEELDYSVALIEEYDAQLHDYNGVVLYQAEAQIVKLIGNRPGITGAECAVILKKSVSACSQLIKKLRKKEWVEQKRNELNNRIYNLYLTDEGKKIYKGQKIFEERCYHRTYALLDQFSMEDLQTYCAIQKCLNIGFEKDVKDGKHIQPHANSPKQPNNR